MFDINNVIDRLLIRFPIFKILINNITFIERKSIDTACTNGSIIFYNSSFFETLSKDEQVFIIAHELLHITLKHLTRRNDRNMEVWNYVTDAVINQILKQSGLPIVQGTIDCPDALNYSAEEYYEIIINRPDCEELMKKYRSEPQSRIATHEHWNEDMQDETTKDIPDINEKNFSQVNKKLIQKENSEFTKNIGNSPQEENISSIGREKAHVDWKTLLNRMKKRVIGGDYNLSHGEFNEEGIYTYPFELIKSNEIEILIDTSGSVDEELVRAFLREIKNIFRDFKVKVGCFDVKFYGFQTIEKESDLDNFTIQGRGGTDFEVASKAFSSKAKMRIVFTDGGSMMPTTSRKITWIIYSGKRVTPPEGDTIVYMNPDEILQSRRHNR